MHAGSFFFIFRFGIFRFAHCMDCFYFNPLIIFIHLALIQDLLIVLFIPFQFYPYKVLFLCENTDFENCSLIDRYSLFFFFFQRLKLFIWIACFKASHVNRFKSVGGYHSITQNFVIKSEFLFYVQLVHEQSFYTIFLLLVLLVLRVSVLLSASDGIHFQSMRSTDAKTNLCVSYDKLITIQHSRKHTTTRNGITPITHKVTGAQIRNRNRNIVKM